MTITARGPRKPKAPKPDEVGIYTILDMMRQEMTRIETDAAERIAAAEARAIAAENAVNYLTAAIEDHTGLIRQLTNAASSTTAAITALGERVGANHAAAVDDVRRLDDDFTAVITRIETAHGEFAVSAAEAARETAATVATLRSALPRTLMIDHAGDLLATLNNGDVVTIGPVRGAPGASAPTLTSAAVAHGHLRLNMSDGTSVLAELPIAAAVASPLPAAVVPPSAPARTAAGDKVKAAIRLGVIMDNGAGESLTAIGKKFGITARAVSRIIREYKHA